VLGFWVLQAQAWTKDQADRGGWADKGGSGAGCTAVTVDERKSSSALTCCEVLRQSG